MTTSFDAASLPQHIRVERSGRGRDGTLIAALVCTVCADEEETPDTPQALRALAVRFVPDHMECAPVDIDD